MSNNFEVNKQFYNEAFKNLIANTQKQLADNKDKIPKTALHGKEKPKKPVPINYIEVNDKGEDNKTLLINNDSSLSKQAMDLLGDLGNGKILKEPISKNIPKKHWVMRLDGEGDYHFEIALGKQKKDSLGNLLKGESIEILVKSNGDPIAINISYTDLTKGKNIGYLITLNPNGDFELTKGGESDSEAFKDEDALRKGIIEKFGKKSDSDQIKLIKPFKAIA